MGSLAYSWKQEGRKEEKITLAKKMIVKKKPLQEIIEFTGLTEKEIEKLK